MRLFVLIAAIACIAAPGTSSAVQYTRRHDDGVKAAVCGDLDQFPQCYNYEDRPGIFCLWRRSLSTQSHPPVRRSPVDALRAGAEMPTHSPDLACVQTSRWRAAHHRDRRQH
jgi:hypothetical protein